MFKKKKMHSGGAYIDGIWTAIESKATRSTLAHLHRIAIAQVKAQCIVHRITAEKGKLGIGWWEFIPMPDHPFTHLGVRMRQEKKKKKKKGKKKTKKKKERKKKERMK
jgi:hypothetical protein